MILIKSNLDLKHIKKKKKFIMNENYMLGDEAIDLELLLLDLEGDVFA